MPDSNAVTQRRAAPLAAASPSALVTADTPMGLIQAAIEHNASVEQIERLVGLYERMEDRQAARQFSTAMSAFQQECSPVLHNKGAEFVTRGGGKVKYSYAELDQIARAINPILAKHGLSYSWDSSVEKDVLTCVCTVRHTNGHSVSSKFTLPTANDSAASPQQKIGMALTFAQRRSLSSVLGLTTTDEDVDVAEVDPTTINEEQLSGLEDLAESAGVDMPRFLAYMGVGALKDIRLADLAKAQAALQARKSRQEKSV